MTPTLILTLIGLYFLMLIAISFVTGKDDNNAAFFLGNKQSPWYVVAFGMIGASLSGVTFISVPGWINTSQFSYFQVVLGYLVGYFIIARVLLPLYYKLNLTTIYGYLEGRFGVSSYKTGAAFFLLSRVIGASFRLFLVANVLQDWVFDQWNIPFAATVAITIGLIWLYTFRSGIKTIIWTDTLQTLFMLLAAGLTVWTVRDALPGDQGLWETIWQNPNSQVFFWDNWMGDARSFWKSFVSGIFITIVMTGLDQDMMQKNLSCKSLKEAQKNMYWFSGSLVFVNLLFLILGLLLYDYAAAKGIAAVGDQLFPAVALGPDAPLLLGVFFIIGLIAAAYSSADSALTSLTTSFCVDFLGMDKRQAKQSDSTTRKWVHVGFSVLLLLVIVAFKYVVAENVIKELFTAAGFTYGPLLGLFAFGVLTPLKIKDRWVPVVAILAPVVSFYIQTNSVAWLGYAFGFEILLVNGLLTFLGLWLLRERSTAAG